MDAAGRLRMMQLRRLLSLAPSASDEDVRRAIAARASDLGAALALEAAENDDVTSAESALDYLDSRLRELAPLVPAASLAAVRQAFALRTAGW